MGCVVSVARLPMPSDEMGLVEFWDVGGHPAFRESRSLFYHQDAHIDGVMLVYDLANPRSAAGLSAWLDELAAFGLAPRSSEGYGRPKPTGALWWWRLLTWLWSSSSGQSGARMRDAGGGGTGADSSGAMDDLSFPTTAAAAGADLEGGISPPSFVIVANKRELRQKGQADLRELLPTFRGGVIETSAAALDIEAFAPFFRDVRRHRRALCAHHEQRPDDIERLWGNSSGSGGSCKAADGGFATMPTARRVWGSPDGGDGTAMVRQRSRRSSRDDKWSRVGSDDGDSWASHYADDSLDSAYGSGVDSGGVGGGGGDGGCGGSSESNSTFGGAREATGSNARELGGRGGGSSFGRDASKRRWSPNDRRNSAADVATVDITAFLPRPDEPKKCA
ncbi:unnamed protein product [Phaeothamnion confervicola]